MPAQLIVVGLLLAYLAISVILVISLIRSLRQKQSNRSLSDAIQGKPKNKDREMKLNEEFLALLVHELRAPLTAIIGTTDMVLNEPSLTEPVKTKLLQSMQTESQHMLNLVNDLLDATKMQAGKFTIEPVEGNIIDTLKTTLDNFRPQIEQQGLTLTTDFGQQIPKLNYDTFRIEQVLNNMISNAIKYTEQGTINISAQQQDNSIVVRVKDSGQGIEKERLRDLFEKYQNFGNLKTTKKDSTGLGLFIAKGIIDAHNGKIWAESEGPGKGSTFSFSLPLS